MNQQAETLIENLIINLRQGIEDDIIYEHIIASVLEIYTEGTNYTEVLNKLSEEVIGLKEDTKTFEALCGLAASIANYNTKLNSIYNIEQETVYSQDEWEKTNQDEWTQIIAGEVYSYIHD